MDTDGNQSKAEGQEVFSGDISDLSYRPWQPLSRRAFVGLAGISGLALAFSPVFSSSVFAVTPSAAGSSPATSTGVAPAATAPTTAAATSATSATSAAKPSAAAGTGTVTPSAAAGTGTVTPSATSKPTTTTTTSTATSKPTTTTTTSTATTTATPAPARPLADGIYVIASAKDSTLVFDVPAFSTVNGQALALWSQNNGDNQYFELVYTGGYYRIRSVSSMLTLGVGGTTNSTAAAGQALVQSTDAAADSQRFALIKNKDGSFKIGAKPAKAASTSTGTSAGSAASASSSAATGTSAAAATTPTLFVAATVKISGKLALAAASSATTQSFIIKPVTRAIISTNKVYRITPRANQNLALDVDGESRANGAAIIAWPYWGGLNEKFLSTRQADGTFSFTAIHSGRHLTVSGSLLVQGGMQATPSKYQKFRLVRAVGGTRILNEASGYYISVTKSGALSLSTSKSASSNLFFLAAAPVMASGTYQFYTPDGGYLGIQGSSKASGARAALLAKNSSPSLAWKATVSSVSPRMRLVCCQSGKALDISGASAAAGTPMIQWDYWGGSNQKFIPVPSGSGWFALENGLGTYASAASAAPGALLKTTSSLSNALKFRFAAATYFTSVKLDAQRLLFAKTGDKLTVVAVAGPGNVSLATADFATSNSAVATVNSSGVVTAKGYGECTISVNVNGHTASCPVSVANKWVAMTFDDGPSVYTSQLLDDLKKRNVKATFFVVGSMASGRGPLLQRMLAEGHEIGNHTYNHNGAASVLASELLKTDNVIYAATGQRTKLMRPPGGAINIATRNCGKAIILWTVDPRDWADRNTPIVYNRVISATSSGNIVLLHDLYGTSTAAAVQVIDTLKQRGYMFVTVSQLLGNPLPNVVYGQGAATPRTQKVV